MVQDLALPACHPPMSSWSANGRCLEETKNIVDCDVRALAADVVAVETLAHLQLTARRLGCRIRLRRPSHELAGLLGLSGLNKVLPTCGLRVG